MSTLYEVLDVSPSTSEEDLKRAYRKRQRETHPDVEGGSAEAFRAVQEAWEVLKDPNRRADYDNSLRRPTYTPRPDSYVPNYGASQPGVYVSEETMRRMAEQLRRMEEESTLRRMETQLQREQINYLMRPSFPLYGRLFHWATGWYAGSYQAGVQFERAVRWKRWDAVVATLVTVAVLASIAFGVWSAATSTTFDGDTFVGSVLAFVGAAIVYIMAFLGIWGYRWFRWVLRPNLRQFSSR